MIVRKHFNFSFGIWILGKWKRLAFIIIIVHMYSMMIYYEMALVSFEDRSRPVATTNSSDYLPDNKSTQ